MQSVFFLHQKTLVKNNIVDNSFGINLCWFSIKHPYKKKNKKKHERWFRSRVDRWVDLEVQVQLDYEVIKIEV